MIKVFNGNWRGLGESSRALGMIIGFEFREILHHFKGARLAVFMCIVLHADEDGLSWPGYATIRKETGYSNETVAATLEELCKLEINGSRVLMRWRERDANNRFTGSNRYRVFPTAAEIATEEQPESKNQTVDDSPESSFQNVEISECGKTRHEVKPFLEDKPILQDKPERARANARRTRSTKDERTDHPAIRMIQKVTGRLPVKTSYDYLIARLGEHPDEVEFKSTYDAWTAHGYNPRNYAGMLDWYESGQRKPGQAKNGSGKGSYIQDATDILAKMREAALAEREAARNGRSS